MSRPASSDEEVIDLIDVDDAVFSLAPRSIDVADAEPHRPRWMVPAAVVAVVTLLGGALALNNRRSSPTRPNAASTTVADATTTPHVTAGAAGVVATVTTPSSSDLRLVPVVPAGYRVANPDDSQQTLGGADVATSLWSSPGLGASTTSWMLATSITVTGDFIGGFSGPQRLALADGTFAVLTSDDATHHQLLWQTGTTVVSLLGSGWSVEEMIGWANRISLGDSLPTTIGLTTAEGLHLVGSTRSGNESMPVAAVRFIDSSRATFISVAVSPSVESTPIDDFFHDQTVQLVDGPGTFGLEPAGLVGHEANELRYHRNGLQVTITGDESMEFMVDLANSVHHAGDAEWGELTRRAHEAAPATDGPPSIAQVTIGPTPNGTPWTAAVSNSSHAGWALQTTRGGTDIWTPMPGFDPTVASIHTVATVSSTVVVAFAPAAAAAVLRRTLNGIDVDQPLTPLVGFTPTNNSPITTMAGTATLTESLQPFTVSVVAADGTVLVTQTIGR